MHRHADSPNVQMLRYCNNRMHQWERELTHTALFLQSPGTALPSKIKVEKSFVRSKGNPLNSYIREKCPESCCPSNTRAHTHTPHKHGVYAYKYKSNNTCTSPTGRNPIFGRNNLGRLWHNHLRRSSQQHNDLSEPAASYQTVLAGGCNKSQLICVCTLAGELCLMNTDKGF